MTLQFLPAENDDDYSIIREADSRIKTYELLPLGKSYNQFWRLLLDGLLALLSVMTAAFLTSRWLIGHRVRESPKI